MKLFVGTSAYSVKEWKGTFYPEKLPDKEMLAYYATRLGAVEIDSTFRSAPTPARVESWAAQVPADFRFTLKAPMSITHFRRLSGAEEQTEGFLSTARTLGNRLGAVFFQLPPNFKKDLPRLNAFLRLLPTEIRVAFEFRHESWLDEDALDLLRSAGCASCISDTDESETQVIRTADWGYLRLRRMEYSPADLEAWRDRIRAVGWSEAYVFFKHEEAGIAPKLAQQFTELAAS